MVVDLPCGLLMLLLLVVDVAVAVVDGNGKRNNILFLMYSKYYFNV